MIPTAKRDEFKAGLYNFYLVQGPRKDDTSKQAMGVTVSRGKKSDNLNTIPVSFEPGYHHAALGQYECDSQAELQQLYDRLKGEWVREYDNSPVTKAEAAD